MGPIMGGRPIFRDWTNANVVCDGNSLVAGQGASYNESKMPAQLSVKAPLSSVYTRAANIGVNGQTIAAMRGRVATQVTPRFVAGKRNILPVWEGTNTLANGLSVATAIADYTGYCADVRAANPSWYIIALTTLPYGAVPFSGDSAAQINAKIDALNAYLLANYKAMGFDAVVNLRAPGSPFDLAGYTPADFAGAAWETYVGTDDVHLKDAGYALVADFIIAQAFKRLPLR